MQCNQYNISLCCTLSLLFLDMLNVLRGFYFLCTSMSALCALGKAILNNMPPKFNLLQ